MSGFFLRNGTTSGSPVVPEIKNRIIEPGQNRQCLPPVCGVNDEDDR